MGISRSSWVWILAGLWLGSTGLTEAQTRLLRFPDVHGDCVVFTYGGDLWTAAAAGGSATRLTAHPGAEVFARFSPDGEWIAFTGQYDGDEQVYVMPASGGVPKQLTFYPATGPLPPRWGYDNQVYGWTHDGERVLFRSLRDSWDVGGSQLFTVAAAGGLPTPLPMPESGAGDFSPDGRKVVYSPLVRDFRHWKRYEGGWAQELYVFDLETHATTRVTEHPRADRDPMWIGGKIYFTSDRDDKNNLYAYDVASGATEQVTAHRDWDVRWPSADHGAGRIVYELDGELWIYDAASGSSSRIAIEVPDDGVARRPSRVAVGDLVSGIGLSPRGRRALFAARGDVFTVPVEHGPTRNLTRSSGAHDREPVWSPDGKTIAYVSDRDGEEEIWRVDQDGQSPPRQLTDGHQGRFYDLAYSPDGERIAVRDQGQRLYVVSVADGGTTRIADDPSVFGLTYEWSPRGGHLAFSMGHANGQRSLFIWSVADGEVRQVTDEIFTETSPTWDPAGDYLYYLSPREWSPQIGSFEFDYVLDRETYVYALALREDVAHPFPARSDEAAAAGGEGEAGEEDVAQEEAKEPEAVRIDFEGLARRVSRVPMPADNYAGLAAVDGHLLAFYTGAPYYGRESDVSPGIRRLSLEKRESETLIEGVRSAALSADRKKLLVATDSGYQVLATQAGGASPQPVSTTGLMVDLVPAEQWRQIFHEVYRRFRDFFYVENMHGYDWRAVRDRYEPLIDHVAHRSDLSYVIGEMIAELSASHTYVAGGDFSRPARPRGGLLGARFELDEAAGRYRISRVMSGDNAEEAYRSPLEEVGVDVDAGDYLLRINGQDLEAGDNPFAKLRHAGGELLELTVNERPRLEGARTVLVRPIASEDDLIYLGWIEHNRRAVDAASGGKIGYVHLPDMGANGLRQWIKWFYGQVRKQGLIVDVRSNGGGNISSMVIERLRRELLMVDFERNLDGPDSYPGVVFTGHLVCLIDEDTASDGDQFAWVFRRAGLGPLVGKRSWGGVVGYYGRGPLIDGGSVSIAEAGTADPEGRWVIEGSGVEPDYEVENTPADLLAGRDAQLEKGIELLLEKIAAEPRGLPMQPPPAPVKAPRAATGPAASN